MKLSHLSYLFSCVVGGIVLIFGIVVLCGIGFSYVPAHVRMLFGVVLILWGVYRLVLTWSKYKQETREEEEV